MLSCPDFLAKQILFLDSYETKELSFKNDNLILKKDGVVVQQIPCIKVFAIFICGEFTLTSVLIRKMVSYGIAVFLLKRNFEPFATFGAETEGNTLLRKKQYFPKNDFERARKLVDNKIGNQIELLKTKRGKTEEEKKIMSCLKSYKMCLDDAQTIGMLMGYEGIATKDYFKVYFESIGWSKRLPRTKYDIPNTLLDIGYTFLFHFIDANLRLYGFDVYVGVLHQQFYMRKSLVCDLVEPFRCIIDRALLKAFHLKQVDEKDFVIQGNQYILKYESASKYARIFFRAILNEKESIFRLIQSYYRSVMKENGEFFYFDISQR